MWKNILKVSRILILVLFIAGCGAIAKNWTKKHAVYKKSGAFNGILTRAVIDNLTLEDVDGVIDEMGLALNSNNNQTLKSELDVLRDNKNVILEKLKYGPYIEVSMCSMLFAPENYGADLKAVHNASGMGEKAFYSPRTNNVLYMIKANNRLYYFHMTGHGLMLWQDTQEYDTY